MGEIDNERNEVLKWSIFCLFNRTLYNIFTQKTIFLFLISLIVRRGEEITMLVMPFMLSD